MTHPTEQQLHAWLDGDTAGDAARAGETAAHVQGCARCQQRVASVRDVGSALRAWADESAPAPADDFADRVMRAIAADGDSAKPSAPPAVRVPATGASGRVVRPSRWLRAAVPAGVLLAAAAAVLVVIQPPQPEDRVGTSVAIGPRGAPKLATGTARGTEVLAIQPAQERTTYSVMEVAGEVEGVINSVVWIEDQPDETAPSAVPSVSP